MARARKKAPETSEGGAPETSPGEAPALEAIDAPDGWTVLEPPAAESEPAGAEETERRQSVPPPSLPKRTREALDIRRKLEGLGVRSDELNARLGGLVRGESWTGVIDAGPTHVALVKLSARDDVASDVVLRRRDVHAAAAAAPAKNKRARRRGGGVPAIIV